MRSLGLLRLALFLPFAIVPLASYGQFQPSSKSELAMTADPVAPGAAAVYLYREEVDDDSHAFRTIYARIKVLTEEGKAAAIVHIDFPKTFVFNAQGAGSSRMTGGLTGLSGQAPEGPASQNSGNAINTAHWEVPSIAHLGESAPWDTDTYAGKVEVAALEGRVIHSDGTIVPLTGKPSELLKVNKGPRGSETFFVMPGVEAGSVIEYRYQIRYDRFLTAPNWQLQMPYFIHKEHFAFRPSSQFLPTFLGGVGVSDSSLKDSHDNILTDIRVQTSLPAGKAITRDAAGNYILDLADVPPLSPELWPPPLSTRTYSVDYFYTYTPDVKDYWQKQMAWWNKALNAYTEPTTAIRRAADEVVSSSDSSLEKAKKLYDLVQKIENLDASPDGAPLTGSEYIPRGSVETVLLSKKGTSNEIAYLYLALARAVQISVRPVRVASRSLRVFSAQYMDNVQLDTALVSLTIDGREIIVDPGTKMAPFETLHWAHSGAGGVALDSNGKVEIVVMPLQSSAQSNSVLRAGMLNISAEGAVSGTLRVAFTGQQAIQLRQTALRDGADAAKEQINRMLAFDLPEGVQGRVDHIAYLDDSGKQLLAVVPVQGSLSTHSRNRLVLPRHFFGTKVSNPFPEDSHRALPLDVHYPEQEQDQITYVLPARFSLEAAPEDARLNFEKSAGYQLRSKVEGSSVTNTRVLVRAFTLLDASAYNQLHDFYQKVLVSDQQQLVFTASAPAGQ